MKISQTENEKAFDAEQVQEKHCLVWLRSLQKNARSPLAGAVAAGSINGVLLIGQCFVLADILHGLIVDRVPVVTLTPTLVALVLIFFGRAGCLYATRILGKKSAIAVKRELRQQLSERFVDLGVPWLKQQASGSLLALTAEHCEALDPYFSRYLPQQFLAVIIPLLIVMAVFPVNWVVAVIFLVTGPLVPLFMILIGMGAAAANRKQFLALAWMSGYFLDRLQALTTLRIFGQAQAELLRIKQIDDEFRAQTMSVLRIAFLSSAALEFLSAVAVALVAVYVGLGLLGLVGFGPAADIRLREALVVLMLAPEFFQPLRQLAVCYHDRAAAVGAAASLLPLLQAPPESENRGVTHCANAMIPGDIRLTNVGKRYRRQLLFEAVDWHIKPGEHWIITGRSGAGKSTLLALLLGLERPSSGQIFVAGQPVTAAWAAGNISWMGQRPLLFTGTLADNISLFDASVSRQQVNAAADAAGVSEFTQRLPAGLETPLGERGYGLSGGQIQRVALARVLLKPAPIVVLDEPTAHLDPALKRALIDDLRRMFDGRTLLIASHDPMLRQCFDHHKQLIDGRLR